MTCHKAKAQLGRYLDGELSRCDEPLLKEHLLACSACAQDLGELREVGSLLRGAAAPPPPAGLARGILARVRMGPARCARRGWLAAWQAWSVPMRFAAAGTAVAAICAGLLAGSAGAPARDASELAWLQTRPPVVAAYYGVPR
jgi:anti-sigma factor RsiW